MIQIYLLTKENLGTRLVLGLRKVSEHIPILQGSAFNVTASDCLLHHDY